MSGYCETCGQTGCCNWCPSRNDREVNMGAALVVSRELIEKVENGGHSYKPYTNIARAVLMLNRQLKLSREEGDAWRLALRVSERDVESLTDRLHDLQPEPLDTAGDTIDVITVAEEGVVKKVTVQGREFTETLPSENCAACRHYWWRKGACAKAPGENDEDRRYWSEPSHRPRWCPGFERDPNGCEQCGRTTNEAIPPNTECQRCRAALPQEPKCPDCGAFMDEIKEGRRLRCSRLMCGRTMAGPTEEPSE